MEGESFLLPQAFDSNQQIQFLISFFFLVVFSFYATILHQPFEIKVSKRGQFGFPVSFSCMR